jgi:hypothetical protein
VRGDLVDEALLAQLARVRYHDLVDVIPWAWDNAAEWVEGIVARYDVVGIDPLSAIESALDLNFEQRNTDYLAYYDRLIQPVTSKGVAVAMVDNIGHAIDAQRRAKGASAKSDRADLTFACATAPGGLVIRCTKVRTVRAPFRRGDEWLFDRDTQRIERKAQDADGDTTWRPTTLMARVSELIQSQPGIGKQAIRSGVQGRNVHIDQALRHLIEDGYVERREDGQAHRHHPIRPYTADDEPCPDRAPTTVPTVPTLAPGVPAPCPDDPSDRAHRAIKGRSPDGHGGRVTNDGHDPDAELERITAKYGHDEEIPF